MPREAIKDQNADQALGGGSSVALPVYKSIQLYEAVAAAAAAAALSRDPVLIVAKIVLEGDLERLKARGSEEAMAIKVAYLVESNNSVREA